MTDSNGNGSLPYHNLYINGQWRTPLAEQYRPTVDPSTGEQLAMIAQADIEDTRLAIQAARAAFDDGYWANMQPGERSRLMHQLVDALEARQDEIAEAEMRDGGCTWRKAFLLDIPVGLIHFRHFAKLADFDPMEPVPQITFPALSYNMVRREPIGVCGQIIPWNFPFLMAVWKVAPALAAGNYGDPQAGHLHAAECAQDGRDHPRHGAAAAGRAQPDHGAGTGRGTRAVHKPDGGQDRLYRQHRGGPRDHDPGVEHDQEGDAGVGRQEPQHHSRRRRL